MLIPAARRPYDAPVPVGPQPTSRRRNAGASMAQRARCSGALDLDLGTLHQRGIADGGFMGEGEVGEVQEMSTIKWQFAATWRYCPPWRRSWVVEPVEVGSRCGIGAGGIAHP
jgi:hypothetical protein